MEQIGKILTIEDNYATVLIKRPTACGENCAMCKGCETSSQKAKVLNPINAKIGDTVKIELSTSKVLFASFAVYILPLIAFIIGYAAFDLFWGLIFFIVPFAALWTFDKKLAAKYTGTITTIIDGNNQK